MAYFVFLPPATKLRQDNVFTPVCHSVHRGVSATPGQTPPQADTPPGQTPPTQCMLGYTHPPVQCMLGYGQQAVGTHPTGMHTC